VVRQVDRIDRADEGDRMVGDRGDRSPRGGHDLPGHGELTAREQRREMAADRGGHVCGKACASAAWTVLTISMATVIGPTPPGTGEIAPATSDTSSNFTSPISPSGVRCTPTSSTVAPGLIMSAVTRCGTPAAATTMSARRVAAFRSFVLMWVEVTVA